MWRHDPVGSRNHAVLALADRPFHADAAKLAANYDVDAILTLGDLQPSWLESLDKCCQPKLGVYGNHDDEPYMTYFGIDNLHLNQIDLNTGLTFAGFESCVSYKRSGARACRPEAYTQNRRRSWSASSPGGRAVLCHCPPAASTTTRKNPAHIGFEALRDWVDKCRPKWLLHGHVRPSPGSLLERIGDTRVVYVNGAKVLNLTSPNGARAARAARRSGQGLGRGGDLLRGGAGLLRGGRHLLGQHRRLLGDRGHLGDVALGARRLGRDLADGGGDLGDAGRGPRFSTSLSMRSKAARAS